MPKTDTKAEPQVSVVPRRVRALSPGTILESAQAVFAETGFIEARISDIAERAGLSHGSFYHYFESKEQIFREVAEELEARLSAPPTEVETATAAAASEYERILRANVLYLERYRANGRIMGVIEEVSRYDKFVNEGRMQRQKHFAERSERAIHRLQDAGQADPEIDPRSPPSHSARWSDGSPSCGWSRAGVRSSSTMRPSS